MPGREGRYVLCLNESNPLHSPFFSTLMLLLKLTKFRWGGRPQGNVATIIELANYLLSSLAFEKILSSSPKQ